MRVAICDDEKTICELLGKLLQKEDPGAEVCFFYSAEELLAAAEDYQLLFLDIQMPGLKGIDAARRLRERNADICIIFVTAVKEYVFEAFDVAAFHYLLKPVDEEKFAQVYAKARKECERKEEEKKLAGEEQPKPLVIKTRHDTYTIAQADILYIESQVKKQVLHTAKGDIICYGKLNELQEKLGKGFYRCHRSYLVNMAYINGYTADEIRLTDGGTVYMAKERYADFRKSYLHYLKNGGVSNA
ncbi:MAG: response regulator transcription factor [Lachnospiraceae bacterium]|nr:response regulator transcription factor [Lachnospiraceae bacterium]